MKTFCTLGLDQFLSLHSIGCKVLNYSGCKIALIWGAPESSAVFDYVSLRDMDYILVSDPISAAFSVIFAAHKGDLFLGRFLMQKGLLAIGS